MNIYSSSPCSLINSFWESSLFKWFVEGEVILKSICFSNVNRISGWKLHCSLQIYKHCCECQWKFFFNSIPITTLGKVGIGETGNIWKLKVGATIFPTEEKCKTCGGKKKGKICQQKANLEKQNKTKT